MSGWQIGALIIAIVAMVAAIMIAYFAVGDLKDINKDINETRRTKYEEGK